MSQGAAIAFAFLVVLVLIGMALTSCEAPSPYVYTLRAEHPNGATNVYRTYFDPYRCEQSRVEASFRNPEVEWRCVRTERTQ